MKRKEFNAIFNSCCSSSVSVLFDDDNDAEKEGEKENEDAADEAIILPKLTSQSLAEALKLKERNKNGEMWASCLLLLLQLLCIHESRLVDKLS